MRIQWTLCLLFLTIAASTGWSNELPSRLPTKLNDVVETVVERDKAGVVREERQVALDAELNFINHGTLRKYDEKGQLVLSANYNMGQRNGEWSYHFTKCEEGSPLVINCSDEFKRPFVARGTYNEGLIDGKWTIEDAEGRIVFESQYLDGQCHGTNVWYHSNGQKRLEIPFEFGVAVETCKHYDAEGQVIKEIQHVNGRPLLTKVGHHKGGGKAFEGTYLGETVTAPEFAWWDADESTEEVASADAKAPLQRHGTWTTWFPSGERESVGEFVEGLPHGRYEWWYESGQRSIIGQFDEGQPHGQWVRWHANGMRKSMVNYNQGEVAGEWMSWDEQGRLSAFALAEDGKKGPQADPANVAPKAATPTNAAAPATRAASPKVAVEASQEVTTEVSTDISTDLPEVSTEISTDVIPEISPALAPEPQSRLIKP